MDDTTILKLYKGLAKKTTENALSWQRTADGNTYLLSLRESSVSVQFQKASNGTSIYTLSVRNEKGEVVDSVRVGPGSPRFKMVAEIFDVAKRNALKTDETIANVLEQLR